MSQFPLEGGNPIAGRVRRGRGRQLSDGGGITQTLDAPGMIPLPAIATSGQKMAADLAQSLGLIGNAADAVRVYSEGEQARARRIASDLKVKANEIEQADRGAANLHAQNIAPELERQILAGELNGDGQPDQAFADSLLAQHLPDGLSAEYKDQFAKSLQPRVMNALSDRRKAGLERSKSAQQELIFAGAAGAESPQQIGRIVNAAIENNPDLPRHVAQATATKMALSHQAKVGDKATFDKWADVAAKTPGVGADDITEARTAFQARTALEDRIKTQHFQDEIAGGMLKAQKGETTLEFVRSEAERRWSGRLGPEALKAGLDQIDAEAASRRFRVTDEAKKQVRRDWDETVINQVAQHMSGAAKNGGAATVPSKLEETIKLPDGTTIPASMTRDEAVKAATDRTMDTIARTMPPEDAFNSQLRFVSENGVVYDGWARPMQAGAAVTFSDIASTKPGEVVPVPANLATGFELYKRLGSVNPIVRDRHVGQNTQAADLYATAQVAQEEITNGDARAALGLAVKAAQRRATPGFQETDNDAIRTAARSQVVNWGFDKPISNGSDVYERVNRIAKVYVDGLGLSPPRAVEKAVERVRQSMAVVNGWAINTAGRAVPQNLGTISSSIAEKYVAAHADEGVDAADLTLIPGPTDRTWILYNKALERPVENWSTAGYFNDGQIAGMSDDAQAQEAAKPSLWSRISRQPLFDQSKPTLKQLPGG